MADFFWAVVSVKSVQGVAIYSRSSFHSQSLTFNISKLSIWSKSVNLAYDVLPSDGACVSPLSLQGHWVIGLGYILNLNWLMLCEKNSTFKSLTNFILHCVWTKETINSTPIFIISFPHCKFTKGMLHCSQRCVCTSGQTQANWL